MLESFGLPAPFAAALADADQAIANGELYLEDDSFEQLIGRPTKPWRETIAEAIAARD